MLSLSFRMSQEWIWLFLALYALLSPGFFLVEGVDVFTSSDLEVVNGTDIKLKCTFKSTSPLSEDKTSASWSFQPLDKTGVESIFHYQQSAYPPTSGRFKDHAVWSGNLMNGDASITLRDVMFSFNGTYSCNVRNPPDIHGILGEIELRVVQRVSFSEIGILAIAVGGSIGIILLVLIIYILVRVFRRRDSDSGIEMATHTIKDQVL